MQVGEISVGVTGTITSLKTVLAQARAESEATARSIGSSFDRLDMGKNIGKGVASFQKILTGIGIAAGGTAVAVAAIQFGRESVQTGMQFEHVMKMVQAVTEATSEEYKALNALAAELGATTEFTAKQAAEGLKVLAQAGLNAKSSMEALPGVLDLATIGEMSIAEAAETAIAAVNAFRMPMENIGKVNDVVAKTAIKTNVDVKDLAETFKYAAPAAAAFGYTIEELAGYAGLLGNLGIKGSMAGTQLSFAFQQVPDMFKKVGMDGEGKKLIDALELINQKGMRTGEILEIFGDRGGRAALGLLTLTGHYKDFVGELENAEGTSQKMADTIRGSTLGAFKELQSTIEGLQLDFFRQNQDLIKQGFIDLTEALRAMKPIIVDVSSGLTQFFNIVARAIAAPIQKSHEAKIAIDDLGVAVYAWARDTIKGQDQINKEMGDYDNALRNVVNHYKQLKAGETHLENMDSLLKNAIQNWKELTKTARWQTSVGLDPGREAGLGKMDKIIEEMFSGDSEAQSKIKQYLVFRADRWGVTETEVRKKYNEAIDIIKTSFPKEKHKEMIEYIAQQFESKYDIELNPRVKIEKVKAEKFPEHELQKMYSDWGKEIESWKYKEKLSQNLFGDMSFDPKNEEEKLAMVQRLREIDKAQREEYLRYVEGDVDKLKKIRDKAKEVYGDMGSETSDWHRRPSGRAEIGPYDEERTKENLKQIEEQYKEHGDALKKLTADTFESMRETVSDVYLKALEGDLKDFEDVYKSFMSSLRKITADYFAQISIEGLFGTKGEGGGLLDKIFGSKGSSGGGGGGIIASLAGIIGGLFGGGSSTTAAQNATYGQMMKVKHEGGDFYRPGALMRPAVNLASDEYAAILKKSEVVSNPENSLNQGRMRSVVNFSTGPIVVQAPKGKVTTESISQLRASLASEMLLAQRRNG